MLFFFFAGFLPLFLPPSLFSLSLGKMANENRNHAVIQSRIRLYRSQIRAYEDFIRDTYRLIVAYEEAVRSLESAMREEGDEYNIDEPAYRDPEALRLRIRREASSRPALRDITNTHVDNRSSRRSN